MTDVQTIAVEGQVTAVDTLTALTTFGAESPQRRVDTRGTHIRQIGAAVSADGAALGEAVFGIKLSGDAMTDIQRFFIGSYGAQLITTGHFALPAFVFDTSMLVKGGDVVTVEATMAGSDVGTATVSITMVIADGTPEARVQLVSVEGTATAVDTLTAMTTFGADTGMGPVAVTTKAKSITREWIVAASNSGATGEANSFVRISGTALGKSGNFDFAGSAWGGTNATGGASMALPSVYKFVFEKLEANQIVAQALFSGIDTGQLTIGITLEEILGSS